MLITLQQLENDPALFDESVQPGMIDYGLEVEQRGPLTAEGRADLIEEHHGPKQIVSDIRLRAKYEGHFAVPCARCLETVEHAVKGEFDLIFRPLGVDGGGSEHSITASETEIGYYQDNGLLLEDVLREQVLLSLPAKTLCGEGCKGLCLHCGCNLNSETCACLAAPADPRWSALSDLGSRLKS